MAATALASSMTVARTRRATTADVSPITRQRKRTRTRPPTRRPELAPGYRAGAWRVEHPLGRGGMASVFAVVHAKFGKRAALKLAHQAILGPQFSADTFLREARVVNLVEHPCVPDVFATGSYDGRPYLVMERLVGETLGARLDRGPLPRTEAIEILLELCDVLATAHRSGVVHRDLKLENIFLLESPCAGGHRVKLVDWGVARILGEDDPLVGMIAGTLTYVAPEQVRGEEITPAADVYSLAVLAYQMLLGEPPFASLSDLELIHKHLRETPPAPSSLWAEIPGELEALLRSMLAKQPAERPAMSAVRAVLEAMRTELTAARAQRDAAQASWLVSLPAVPPVDMFGRPALTPLLGSLARHRMLGAVLAVGLALASLGCTLGVRLGG